MQLTIRDLEILRFINDFGFCEMSHLNNHFNLRVPRCYQLISRLINGNLIKAEKVFFRQERILSLTPKGAKHTNFPAMNQLSLSRYKHTIQVINVYLLRKPESLSKCFACSIFLATLLDRLRADILPRNISQFVMPQNAYRFYKH